MSAGNDFYYTSGGFSDWSEGSAGDFGGKSGGACGSGFSVPKKSDLKYEAYYKKLNWKAKIKLNLMVVIFLILFTTITASIAYGVVMLIRS